ncbi:MAG: hypothetical protein JWQ38_2873 [Flavipsychrobacter sp.]|nr:hypothetical protein [Flavipsychrobacter sp.]
MYCITDEQIEYILNDIKSNGVEMEDLRLNLLDHICCKVEQEFKENDDFERFYKQAVKQLCRNSLHEIEEETINLLTYKNYYFMKKAMMISGGVSAAIFMAGCFFKLMHWPGASVLLFLGITLMSLVFLPLAVLLKGKQPGSGGAERFVLFTGALTGITYSMATLFTVMHWPGSNILWFTTVGISLLVFIPAYFFTGIRNPEKKVNTILTSVLLVGATGLIFTMLRVRPEPPTGTYTYLESEELLKTMQNSTSQNDPLAADINSTCRKIKELVLQQETGLTAIPADFESKQLLIRDHNIGNILSIGEGAQLLKKLRTDISNFNASASASIKIPVAHSILDAEGNNLQVYTNLSALNSITQLQMYLAIAGKNKSEATTVVSK